MSYLPPVGWADVATKRDLDHLADRLRVEFDEGLRDGLGSLRRDLGSRIDSLDDKLDANLRELLFSMLGAIFTIAGLASGAALSPCRAPAHT